MLQLATAKTGCWHSRAGLDRGSQAYTALGQSFWCVLLVRGTLRNAHCDFTSPLLLHTPQYFIRGLLHGVLWVGRCRVNLFRFNLCRITCIQIYEIITTVDRDVTTKVIFGAEARPECTAAPADGLCICKQVPQDYPSPPDAEARQKPLAKSAGQLSHTEHFFIALSTDSLENRNFSNSQRNTRLLFRFLLDRHIYDDHKEKITTNPGKKGKQEERAELQIISNKSGKGGR